MPLTLTILSRTTKVIQFGWTPVQGALGYRFFMDGVALSHTMDPTRDNVRFAIPDNNVHTYEVLAMMPGVSGTYKINTLVKKVDGTISAKTTTTFGRFRSMVSAISSVRGSLVRR